MLSTLIIIGSSFLVHLAEIKLNKEDSKGVIKLLGLNILSTSFFLVIQSFAWVEMYQQGLFFDGLPAASFLYILSGLHMVHIFIGLGFLIHSFATIGKKTQDDVQRLVFFSNPYEKTRLEVLFLYWHYLGAIWLMVYLFLFFAL
jgi:cytochrome c oxidase subunit 3